MRLCVLLLAFIAIAQGQTLTHYGSASDSLGDSNSARGIGAFNFSSAPGSLVPMQSAALSASVAAQYGISPGQSFSVTAGGQTYNLIYADVVPSSYTDSSGQVVQEGPRIDVYDPNNVLGSANEFSAPVSSVNSGPVLFGNGVANTASGGTTFTHANMPGIVSTLLSRFQNAGQAWTSTIKQAATNLFWILALISLVWTGTVMLLRQDGLVEIMAELIRFIMFTGFFFWLLQTGPDLAGKIIASLWQIGGQAGGVGNEVFPGDLVTIGMQVFQKAIAHINWFQPESIFVPVLITFTILVVCVLTAANVVLLLCAAWVVLYAGLIFLGFGGCRWTSDMAIGYYRTMLGIGVSLMTMLLIMGVGIKFLEDLAQLAGQTPDVPSLAAIMCAAILLAVIVHRLPTMVSGIATGSGSHAGIGTLGYMTMLGAAMSAGNLARAAASGGATAGMASKEGHEMLAERIAAVDAYANSGAGQPLTAIDPNPAAADRQTTPDNTYAGVRPGFYEPMERVMTPDEQREEKG